MSNYHCVFICSRDRLDQVISIIPGRQIVPSQVSGMIIRFPIEIYDLPISLVPIYSNVFLPGVTSNKYYCNILVRGSSSDTGCIPIVKPPTNGSMVHFSTLLKCLQGLISAIPVIDSRPKYTCWWLTEIKYGKFAEPELPSIPPRSVNPFGPRCDGPASEPNNF